MQSASISCSPASVASSTAVTLFQNRYLFLDITVYCCCFLNFVYFSCPTTNGLLLQAVHGQPSLSRPHHICLSFRLPRSAQCAQIYIHAHLRVCHTGRIDAVRLVETAICLTLKSFKPFSSKVCANGGTTAARCAYRERRDAEIGDVRPVVFGPIYLVEGDGATDHVTYLGADQPVAMGKATVESNSSSAYLGLLHHDFRLILYMHYHIFTSCFSESFLNTSIGFGLLLIVASTVVALVCLKREGHFKQIEQCAL